MQPFSWAIGVYVCRLGREGSHRRTGGRVCMCVDWGG